MARQTSRKMNPPVGRRHHTLPAQLGKGKGRNVRTIFHDPRRAPIIFLTSPGIPESLLVNEPGRIPDQYDLSRPCNGMFFRRSIMEENRLGIVGIIVENLESSAALNAILHQYSDIIVGRLGIPYRDRGVSIISIAVDGSNEAISAMTGKIGQLEHVSVKSVITK